MPAPAPQPRPDSNPRPSTAAAPHPGLPPNGGPFGFVRKRIAQGVLRLTSSQGSRIDYSAPLGDPGLFGPHAVCWKVHADFTSMMAGGISALLLQSLHPAALSGVWDHSTFRTDIHGRLGRTATFIAGTTFGPRADALALIERVKTIHRGVRGVTPDGVPYAADDPPLLRWVHVAEVTSFLAAYLRYVDPHLSAAEQDAYLAETAQIACALGAQEVPRTRDEVARYFNAMRGELCASERTRAVVDVLRNAPAPHPAAQPAVKLMFAAGADLLPDWAQQMLGLTQPQWLRAGLVRPSLGMLAPVMRWALVNGVSKRSRARAMAPAVD